MLWLLLGLRLFVFVCGGLIIWFVVCVWFVIDCCAGCCCVALRYLICCLCVLLDVVYFNSVG